MAQLDVDGAAYLQHACSRLKHGPPFPAGRKLRELHAKNRVQERYLLSDLVAACQYLSHIDIHEHGANTRIGVDPEDDVYCKELHDQNCQLCHTCHFCRQKTISRKAVCIQCGDQWCKSCLAGRHGEDRDEIGPGRRFQAWKCPRCRHICNCSSNSCIRANNGWEKTGQLVGEGVKDLGFPSVALYLMLTSMRLRDIAPDALQDAIACIHAEQAQVYDAQAPQQAGAARHLRMPGAALNNQTGAAGQLLPRHTRAPLSLSERVHLELPTPASCAADDRLIQMGFGVRGHDEEDDEGQQAAREFEAAFLGEPVPVNQHRAAAAAGPWWQRPPLAQAVTPGPHIPVPALTNNGPHFPAPAHIQHQFAMVGRPGRISWARAQMMNASQGAAIQGQRASGAGGIAVHRGLVQQQVQQQYGPAEHAGRPLLIPAMPVEGQAPHSTSGNDGYATHSAGHGTAAQAGALGVGLGMRGNSSMGEQDAVRRGTSPNGIAEVSLQLFGKDATGPGGSSGGDRVGGDMLGQQNDEAQSAHKRGLSPVPLQLGVAPAAGAIPSPVGLPAEGCRPLMGVVLRPGAAAKPGIAADNAGQGVAKGGTSGEWEFLHYPGPAANPLQPQQQLAAFPRPGAAGRAAGTVRQSAQEGGWGRERDRAGGWADEVTALHAPKRVRTAHEQNVGQTRVSSSGTREMPPPRRSDPGTAPVAAAQHAHEHLGELQPADWQPAAQPWLQQNQQAATDSNDHTMRPEPVVTPLQGQPQGTINSSGSSAGRPQGAVPAQQHPGLQHVNDDRGKRQGQMEQNAQGGQGPANPQAALVVPAWWTKELEEATSAGRGFFPGLLGVAKQAIMRAQARKAACWGAGLQTCPCAKCTAAEAHLQLVLREAVWAEVLHVQGSLPHALYINDEAMPGTSTGAHRFMRNTMELKCTAALLLLMVEKAEVPIAQHAVMLFFNQEPFIDFERCGPQARAALVLYATQLLKALVRRQPHVHDELLMALRGALEQFAGWIHCVASEHQLHMQISLPLDASKAAQAVDMGFMSLPPPTVSNDTTSCVQTRGSGIHGLQHKDPRDEKVRSIATGTKVLLTNLLRYCQELVVPQQGDAAHPGLGQDACLLLGSPGQASGLASLLDPRCMVAHEVREMALKTVVLIISDACPRWPGADQPCSMSQLEQGRHVAQSIMTQVLLPLELLVSIKYPARRQLTAPTGGTARTQPGPPAAGQGLTEGDQQVMQLLPDMTSKQQLEVAVMRPEVAQRMKTMSQRLGHWPRELLGMAYGALLWCGQLRWPGLLRLLLAPCTLPDIAAEVAKADVRVCQFVLATLAKVVDHLTNSPPAHTSLLALADGSCLLDPLPWSVLRIWAFSLHEPSCRREAGSLSVAIMDLQAERLIPRASAVLTSKPGLQAILGPLLGASQAQDLPQQDQHMGEDDVPGVYRVAELLRVWEVVGRDALGSQARAPGLVILLAGADLSDVQWVEMLQDVGQVWCRASGQALTWRVSLICTTLHTLRTVQALKAVQPHAQTIPLALSTTLRMPVDTLLRHCCEAITRAIAQLDITGSMGRQQAGAAPSHAQNSSWLQKHLPDFQLASCFSALTQMAISTSQAAAPGSPVQLRVLFCQLLCVGILIPEPSQLQPFPNTLCQQPAGQHQQAQDMAVVAARQSPSYLLQQHVVDALLAALFPVLPGNPPIQCTPSNNSWALLQWALCILLHLLVSAALVSSMRDLDRELAALAALRFTRSVLADARMQAVTPLKWLLPPVLMTTMSALHLSIKPGPHGRTPLSCSSPSLVRELYELWAQLMPVLKQPPQQPSLASSLLPPVMCHSGSNQSRNWSPGQLDDARMVQAVSLMLKAMCCHALASARQLRDSQAAGQPDKNVPHPVPHAWTQQDKEGALLSMRQHAGLAAFLPHEADKAQLRTATSSIDSKLSLLFTGSSDASQPSPADWYLQLLEVQLPFILRLTTMLENGSGYVWAAHMLPELCQTLKQVPALPPDIRAAYNRLVVAEQSQRQIAMPWRAQQPQLAAAGAYGVGVGEQPGLVPPQSAWSMLAAPEAPRLAPQLPDPPAGARPPTPLAAAAHAQPPAQSAGAARVGHPNAANPVGHTAEHSAAMKQEASLGQPGALSTAMVDPTAAVKAEARRTGQAAGNLDNSTGGQLVVQSRQPLQQLTAGQVQQLASVGGSCVTAPAARQPELEILTMKKAKLKQPGDSFNMVALLHSITQAQGAEIRHANSLQASTSSMGPDVHASLKLMQVWQPSKMQDRLVLEFARVELQGSELVQSLQGVLQGQQLYDWATATQAPSADELQVVCLNDVKMVQCDQGKRLVMPAKNTQPGRQRILLNPREVRKVAVVMRNSAIAYAKQRVQERSQAMAVEQSQGMEVGAQDDRTETQMQCEQASPLAEQQPPPFTQPEGLS